MKQKCFFLKHTVPEMYQASKRLLVPDAVQDDQKVKIKTCLNIHKTLFRE